MRLYFELNAKSNIINSPKALQMAIFSIKEIKGTTIKPEPMLWTISKNDSSFPVMVSLTFKWVGGKAKLGKPSGIYPITLKGVPSCLVCRRIPIIQHRITKMALREVPIIQIILLITFWVFERRWGSLGPILYEDKS